jgi:glycosyltransferase involved in cell wall biosynthesis
MKIAILCPTLFTFSGIDRVAELQASKFAQNGNQVTIFTMQGNIEAPKNVKLEIIGMPTNLFIQRIYRLFLPLDFVKTRKWASLLQDFDVIYSHQYPMNWLAYIAKKRYGTEFVYYNHGYPPLKTFQNLFERAYIKTTSVFANWTIKRADKAISVSSYLRQELKKETGMDSAVVYNEIDIKRFHPDIDGASIREKYNIGNSQVILFVGRISPHKGVHLLIRAFDLVQQHFPETKLLIVGKHIIVNYSSRLYRMANKSVIFAQDVADEDLPAYYGACNVFATATMWEGFNLPLLEAISCGKPVVAFNIGPHPEVLKTSVGLLVPAGEIKAMAEAIETLLNNGS